MNAIDEGEVSNAQPAFLAWIVLAIPVLLSICCLAAGQWFALSRGWLYLLNFILIHAFGWQCVRRWNPVVISRRGRRGINTKGWDLVVLFALTAGIIATIVTATNFAPARDAASESADMTWLIGASVFALGYGVMLWCSVVNPYLETTVRIQDDNQHQVIESGPYTYVRHPMYVGLIAVFLATPSMLGSSWLFIPLTWCVAVLTLRTALEDRTLQAELPGYSQYADRIRFRLLPGVW